MNAADQATIIGAELGSDPKPSSGEAIRLVDSAAAVKQQDKTRPGKAGSSFPVPRNVFLSAALADTGSGSSDRYVHWKTAQYMALQSRSPQLFSKRLHRDAQYYRGATILP